VASWLAGVTIVVIRQLHLGLQITQFNVLPGFFSVKSASKLGLDLKDKGMSIGGRVDLQVKEKYGR
jgi:hypothetical protein